MLVSGRLNSAATLVRGMAATCFLMFAACSEDRDVKPSSAAERDAARALEAGDVRLLLLSGVSGEGQVYWHPPGVFCSANVTDRSRGLARPIAGPDAEAPALHAYAAAYNVFLVTRSPRLAAAGCETMADLIKRRPARVPTDG